MTAAAPPSALLDLTAVGATVEELLGSFLGEQEKAAPATPELTLFTSLLRELFAAGGKRIRPQLCVAGWHAVSDEPPIPAVWRVAASLELFHAFALIHDDIMDHSDLRRGRPTAHRALAARHAGRPGAEHLGRSAAMLLGDLALGWSFELLHTSDLMADHLTAVRPVLNALRTETLVGQYLDLSAVGNPTVDAAWRVIRLKTTKYTVERPLQLGALLAGASGEQLRALSAFALPLGDAFQLRDDLLGVFGDPDHTGKGTLDDLREGKHTLLVATAFERASPAQALALRTYLGDPALGHEEAEQVRQILTDTGARDTIERMIATLGAQALAALDDPVLRPAATAALRRLAHAAPSRRL